MFSTSSITLVSPPTALANVQRWDILGQANLSEREAEIGSTAFEFLLAAICLLVLAPQMKL
jgi:hypothetical protein